MSADKVAKTRLFFNADRTKIVEEDDPDAAFLAAAVGQEIPELQAAADEKQANKAANKAAKADGDK